MAALLWVLLAIALGSMLAYRFAVMREFGPKWAAWLLIAGCGTAAGIGITSIVFFACRTLLPGVPVLPMLLELAAVAWLGFEIYRTRKLPAAPAQAKPFAWNPLLAVALLVVLGIGTLAMSGFWDSNPQGNWDAWAIWNLRARFLAAGDHLAARAWSPLLSGSHPEYPLLVSSFVARCWSYSGSASAVAPIATSYALFLALIAIGVGGLAARGSGSLGLLFGLAAASSPFLLQEVPAQYADIPLACYFAGALVLMLLDRPLAAGLLASLAAWTKDEGLLFLAAFLIVMILLRRGEFLRALAGAAPVGALALAFKIFVARGTSSLLAQSTGGIAPRIADPHRYATVLSGILSGLWSLNSGWYHPILPLLVLCALLRFKPDWRRDALPAGALTGCMMLGYFVVYIITPAESNWQIGTTLDRLAAQLWPAVLIAVFAGLRAPEDLAPAAPAEDAPAKTKRGRTR